MGQIETNPSELFACLQELDQWLSHQHIELELTVIGSFAFYLHGIKGIITRDIDTTVQLQDQVLEQIKKIGLKHGMGSEWLSDNASPPAKRFYPNFEEMLEDLRSVVV